MSSNKEHATLVVPLVPLVFKDTLLQELRSEDEGAYKKFLCMSPDISDKLLNLIKEDITRQNTHLRESIQAPVKLAPTIRFLTTGQNYSDLQYIFRVHQSTLGQFIPEVCDAILKICMCLF